MENTESTGSDLLPRWRLYFLAWLDALEKLDILILEIRHLQHTCVYSLREPKLQAVLREEEIIFDPKVPRDYVAQSGVRDQAGESPQYGAEDMRKSAKFFDALFLPPKTDCLERARSVARRFVPLFPTLPPSREEGPEKTSASSSIEERLGVIWTEGLWSDSNKDLYGVLSAAQRIKRQIITDRLTLFLEGHEALQINSGEARRSIKQQTLVEFFLLRVAILSRSHDYLQRIGDLQQRLAQHFESVPAQYPRPSVHRRRMQGAYTFYLADRTNYLRTSMNLFLANTRGKKERPLPTPRIFHRWEHMPTSNQDVFLDELGEPADSHSEIDGVRGAKAGQIVEFVQTGFWMLDKPDNQPILAHEVAHHALRQHYRNLQPLSLAAQRDDDAFAWLITHLTKVLHTYEVPVRREPHAGVRELINPLEIGSDILAASVKGTSYLYAFFLEAVGWGLEHAMVDEHGYIPHLNVRLEYRKNYHAPRVRDLREWYVRGRILLAWTRASNASNCPLDEELCRGFEQVLEDLNEHFDRVTLNPEFKSGFFWRILADQLCRVVSKSDAAKFAEEWRVDRRKDNARRPGKRHFPRGAQRLPGQARYFLVKTLCEHKFELYGDYDKFSADRGEEFDVTRTLRERYDFLDDEDWSDFYNGAPKDTVAESRTLFRHAFDVPWQCAIIRATDFFFIPQAQKYVTHDFVTNQEVRSAADFYIEVNRNTSLGRRLFFVAMEFDGLSTQSPCQRLRMLYQEIRRAKFDSAAESRDESGERLFERINKWKGETEKLLLEEATAAAAGDFDLMRAKQCQQGEAIDQFLNLIEADKDDGKDGSAGRWEVLFGKSRGSQLRRYLEPRSAKSTNGLIDYYQTLVEYHNTVPYSAGKDGRRPASGIRLALASRASVSGNLSIDDDDCENPLLKLYASSEIGYSSSERATESAVVTCGYYNALFVKHDIKQLCRCTAPSLATMENGERMPLEAPLFLRRESWIALKPPTNPESNCVRDLPLSQYMGIYFIQLHRRFARLDFIDWLYQTGSAEIGLSEDDRIYLTDGWADVVLLSSLSGFGAEPRRKTHLFEVGDKIMDHFLIRRVETVATSKWFDLPGSDGEVAYVSVRLDDSSPIRQTPKQFAEGFRSAVLGREIGFNSVSSTPGSMDLTLSFNAREEGTPWLPILKEGRRACDIDRLIIQPGRQFSGDH